MTGPVFAIKDNNYFTSVPSQSTAGGYIHSTSSGGGSAWWQNVKQRTVDILKHLG